MENEKSWFEQNGGTYRIVNGYRIPNLALPDEPEYEIGRFGRMRHRYLKNHRKVLYINLLTGGKLNTHLYEIDQAANDRMELISRQMAETEGVTEQLKAENQMLWVGKVNNICACADEIVRSELIYD